jgi:hypothetical protein
MMLSVAGKFDYGSAGSAGNRRYGRWSRPQLGLVNRRRIVILRAGLAPGVPDGGQVAVACVVSAAGLGCGMRAGPLFGVQGGGGSGCGGPGGGAERADDGDGEPGEGEEGEPAGCVDVHEAARGRAEGLR